PLSNRKLIFNLSLHDALPISNRLCIPFNTLNSFMNLETLSLGYSTNAINDLHLIKLPKLQCLKVHYLTKVKEIIKNTGGYLKIRSEEHTSELQSLRNIVCRLI